ncbi:MAG: dihydrolipoamide acetyltransferase family protein, partial [Micrococcales bacterium]|nr:dihydrolipoamide acetyltransferase family protein [Micrococcales bacterium]
PVAAGAPGTLATDSDGRAIRVISPLVRRLAAERGIDLRAVIPSAPGGIITRRDVERAQPDPRASAPAIAGSATSLGETRIPLTGMRGLIADKLSTSRRQIPDATTWVDVDASALLDLRAQLQTAAPDAGIGLLALLARICVAGLSRYPELNASVDMERREIVRHGGVNLSFAAQSPRGLLVPVVQGADGLTLRELAKALRRLTNAARGGSLSTAQCTGGTFTLNNYGPLGVDGSTPIINHPEAAMLGVGRIIERPWVVDGRLAVRQVAQLSFTFDHRVADGGSAGGGVTEVVRGER